MYGMDDVFKVLFLFFFFVIVVINGYVFGNGVILVCVCDFRFMCVDKGFFCFFEVDLLIFFLFGMIEFVKKVMLYYRFNEMKFFGRCVFGKELE